MDHAAHHPKSDVPTEHQVEMARLAGLWRLRQQQVQAGVLTLRDPLTPRQRRSAELRYARAIKDAAIWLIARNAEKKLRERVEARSRFHVIQGGRR